MHLHCGLSILLLPSSSLISIDLDMLSLEVEGIYRYMLYFLFIIYIYILTHGFMSPFCQVMAASSSAADSEESEEVSEQEKDKKETKKESPPKEKEAKRHRRHRRHRSHHDRSRERGIAERKDRSERRERSGHHRRRRREGAAVPEPEHPPRAKKEPQQDDGRSETKGGGKRQPPKTWLCVDCGKETAPYRAAMDQHRFLNENCLACQVWNRKSRSEQSEPGTWYRCKQEARGLKWGRRSQLVDVDGFEGPLDEHRHRNAMGGWRVAGLPWSQT